MVGGSPITAAQSRLRLLRAGPFQLFFGFSTFVLPCSLFLYTIRTCFFSSFVHKGSSSSTNTTTNRNTAATP